jgi:hypothetical protein
VVAVAGALTRVSGGKCMVLRRRPYFEGTSDVRCGWVGPLSRRLWLATTNPLRPRLGGGSAASNWANAVHSLRYARKSFRYVKPAIRGRRDTNVS